MGLSTIHGLLAVVVAAMNAGYIGADFEVHDGIDILHPTTVQSTSNSHVLELEHYEPMFDHNMPKNITAYLGGSAYLGCRVINLGLKMVSWIRHRDVHILTTGAYKFTHDIRIDVIHNPETNEWTLRIKQINKEDEGIYECQISTVPTKSYLVFLEIQAPTARIMGNNDVQRYQRGSTINLTCIIHSYFDALPITWFKDGKAINLNSDRKDVTLITERGPGTISSLIIYKARKSDSGTYECSPTGAARDNVTVQVANEWGFPAAIQTSSAIAYSSSYLTISCYIFTVLYSIIQLYYEESSR